MEADDVSVREQIFHDRIREAIICVLLFICLYILSYFVITHFKKIAEFVTDDSEDATVNRIALWLCTFTLSVSVGAVLLLPLSILSNEVLLSFPQSYYMQWLNGSLIHACCDHCVQGVMGRVYETAVVLLLLTLLVLGIVWVASALLHDHTAQESLYALWEYYLPYLYSCISLFGVLLLLLCTPFGLSRMFSITGSLLVKPRLLENVEETVSCALFEEASLSRKLTGGASCWMNMDVIKREFLSMQARRVALGTANQHKTPLQTHPTRGHPTTESTNLQVVSVLMVCFHVLELLIDDTAMPRGMESNLEPSWLWSQVCSLYLMVSSVVGFYSSRFFTGLLPRAQDTTLTQIIGNCVSLLVLSSALPVFSRTLGITRFDLLGDFGRYNWLGNFYIVFLYNILFAGLTKVPGDSGGAGGSQGAPGGLSSQVASDGVTLHNSAQAPPSQRPVQDSMTSHYAFASRTLTAKASAPSGTMHP
ncbi:hypothetical protein JZ751_021690, partial [Albula glossodonta]